MSHILFSMAISIPLFLPIGPAEAAIVFLILVLLFGADRIPKLARAFGESIGKFEEGKQKAEEEIDEIKTDVKENSVDSIDEETTDDEDEEKIDSSS